MVVASLVAVVLAAPLLVAGRTVEQRQANATIISKVERGMNTECKMCPFSLCPNTLALSGSTEVTLTCWTEGTDINGDTTWLGTPDGCYITQWDLIEYAGDYTTDLPYCGAIPEVYRTALSRTIYHTECNIEPSFVTPVDRVKMYKPDIELNITCATYTGEASLDTSTATWYKTSSNCYVPELNVEWLGNSTDNDYVGDCGPIPHLQNDYRDDPRDPPGQPEEPEPEEPAEPEPTTGVVPRDAGVDNKLSKRWIWWSRVGEDEAPCRTEPNETSEIVRTLPFGAMFLVQCADYLITDPWQGYKPSDEWYLLTTDFCYIKDTNADPRLYWQNYNSLRFPDCKQFVDTES